MKELLSDSCVQWIFHRCCQHRVQIRLVGGCVRDALLDQPLSDLDFAVNASPDRIIKLFQDSLFEDMPCSVIPTGLKHGTVTLVTGPSKHHRSFELTTLRKDIETDGRHAKVAFTDNWVEDAARRDFTMNALYLDQNGQIFDFFHGLTDLHDGIVRFIGNPTDRIQEDYLRILRYYRFCQRFSKNIDAFSEQAVIALQTGLKSLSKERIQSELFKILDHPNCLMTLQTMEQHGILKTLFEKPADFSLFSRSLALQKQLGPKFDLLQSLFRLFCLYPYSLSFFEQKFCLSNQQKFWIQQWYKALSKELSEQTLFIAYDQGGFTGGITFLILFHALHHHNNEEALSPWLNLLNSWTQRTVKSFPLKGKDLIALGIPAGQQLGQLLKLCRQWWIQHLGSPSKEQCLEFIKAEFL